MDEKTEIEQIEDALLVLLKRIAAEDADENSILVRGQGPTRIGDIAAMSRDQHQTRNIVMQPVRAACFHAVATLGRRMHELNANLVVVCDKALQKAESQEQEAIWASAMGKAWNGIGGWSA